MPIRSGRPLAEQQASHVAGDAKVDEPQASVEAAAEERLVGLVDVEETRLAAAAKRASERGARPGTFFDYRRMFDAVHKDIDAVFVATPDHHHAPASMIAIQLGKHVFCEKPLCHDVHQARALAEAAKKQRVITLMGNQGHCGEGYLTGTITRVSIRSTGVIGGISAPAGWGTGAATTWTAPFGH